MDALQEKILSLVDASQGAIIWEDLIEGLEYREQQQAFNAVRALKQSGVVSRVVSFDPETGTSILTINRVAQS